MTNRLELNWKLDGFVDEQRYYCSETPIDFNNLPVPKAIIASGARTYTDTAIDVGKTYYVAVASVRNGVEKLSDVRLVRAVGGDEHWDKVVALLHFNGNLTDETGFGVYSKTAGVTFTTEHAFNGQAIRIPNTTDNVSTSGISTWQFGGNDFCIEFFLYIDSIVSSSTTALVTKWDGSTRSLCEFVLYIDNGQLNLDVRKNDGSTYVQVIGCEQPPTNQLVHIALSRSGNTFRVFYDGVKKAEQASNVIINAANSTPVRIGGHPLINWGLNGRIDEIRVTKGVARYTANFTPPTEPFPDN